MSWDYVTATLVTRKTVTDRYGNATTTSSETDVPGCLFAPETSAEQVDSRTPGVTTPAQLLMPPGTAPDSDDLIRLGSETWEIIGQPSDWGTGAGAQVALKRWGSG